MVVLDTDHLSLLHHAAGAPAIRLRDRLDHLDKAQVVTTIVSYEEQMRGWLAFAARGRTVTERAREKYREVLRRVDAFPEDRPIELVYLSPRRIECNDKRVSSLAFSDLEKMSLVNYPQVWDLFRSVVLPHLKD